MRHFLILLIVFAGYTVLAQETEIQSQNDEQGEISRDLSFFDRIVISPRINVVLTHGETESIKVKYSGVSESKINIVVEDHALRLYLDDARVFEKSEERDWNYKEPMYRDATITAYVTFRNLEAVGVRGNQEVTCMDKIRSRTFYIRAYGENTITFASIETDYLKGSMYGENTLTILDGRAEEQKYKLFGANRIDTKALESQNAQASLFGNSRIKVNTEDEVRVNSFGDSRIVNTGSAVVVKGVTIGNTIFRRSE